MRKYVTIPDIRECPSYRSINARLLYMHCAMGMEIESRNYTHSWRQLSAELGIPLQQVRTALKILEKDGLIATQQVTQKVTYGLTQQVTHKVTQIHILSVSEIDEASNEASNSTSNSQSNSPTNSQSNSDIINKNNINKPLHAITDARARWIEIQGEMANILNVDEPTAGTMVSDFRRRQAIKAKTWDSEGDLLAHLVAWCEKRMPKVVPSGQKQTRTDHEARIQERQRAQEEEAKETPEEKRRSEIIKLRRWAADARKNKREDLAAAFEDQAKKMEEAG